MSRNMIFERFRVGEIDVMLSLNTAEAPSRAEWADALSYMTEFAQKNDPQRLVTLAVSDGGGPDVSMRADLMSFLKTHRLDMKTAVVTTSRVSRGIVAAVSWFNPQTKAFAPERLSDALAHLTLPAAAGPRLLRELAAMELQLAPSSCLALINATSAVADV